MEDDVDPSEADALLAGRQGTLAPLSAPRSLQQEADAECCKWADEWLATERCPAPPLPPWPLALGQPLPAPCLAVLTAALASFPAATGLGWDNMHPRALLRLPTSALRAMLRLLILAELLGAWPRCIGLVIIVLLPKADGGRRPIGLQPLLNRVWGRVRLAIAQTWQREHERPYFFAGAGKGSTVAAWKQAARAELAATVRAADYGIGLLDLAKAFERVPWDWLVTQAAKFGYNLYLLRLSLAAYALERTINIQGVCSGTVRALRGITAGSSLATVELRVLMIEWLDQASRFHLVTLTVYVDDIGVEAVGHRDEMIKQISAALLGLLRAFAAMRMQFSDTKNMLLASSLGVAASIAATVPALPLHTARTAKSLGAGLGAGVRRSATAARKRLLAFAARRSRFRMLRRAGVNTTRLLKTGGIAALGHAQAVMGVSNRLLLQQRRAAAAVIDSLGAGADLDLTFAVADGLRGAAADPAVAAHVEPIVAWATAAWEQWLPRRALLTLAADARKRLVAAAVVWSAVRGPGAAFVATATRLGWVIHDALTATTDAGEAVMFSRDPPRRIRELVFQSVQRW